MENLGNQSWSVLPFQAAFPPGPQLQEAMPSCLWNTLCPHEQWPQLYPPRSLCGSLKQGFWNVHLLNTVDKSNLQAPRWWRETQGCFSDLCTDRNSLQRNRAWERGAPGASGKEKPLLLSAECRSSSTCTQSFSHLIPGRPGPSPQTPAPRSLCPPP